MNEEPVTNGARKFKELSLREQAQALSITAITHNATLDGDGPPLLVTIDSEGVNFLTVQWAGEPVGLRHMVTTMGMAELPMFLLVDTAYLKNPTKEQKASGLPVQDQAGATDALMLLIIDPKVGVVDWMLRDYETLSLDVEDNGRLIKELEVGRPEWMPEGSMLGGRVLEEINDAVSMLAQMPDDVRAEIDEDRNTPRFFESIERVIDQIIEHNDSSEDMIVSIQNVGDHHWITD